MFSFRRFRIFSLYRVAQLAFLVLAIVLISLHLGLLTTSPFGRPVPSDDLAAWNGVATESDPSLSAETPAIKDVNVTLIEVDPPVKEGGNITLIQAAPTYVKAIMTPDDTSFPRLECPVPTQGRYEYLRTPSNSTSLGKQRRYFFAVNLHDSIHILPRLLGSIVEAIRFLGPAQCALSIVEGRSDDGTLEVLEALSSVLKNAGIDYTLKSDDKDPLASPGARIARLADLRNEALEPMIKHSDQYSTNDTTVVFLNDVSLCMEDILELIHQRVYQKADMTCGMDWVNLWRDPTFYDVWVARGMNGDSFFEIPPDGSWDDAWNLFWNDQPTQDRFDNLQPFQVFACWNGGAVFNAKPLLERKIRFRDSKEGECFQGEPQIFSKEMWHLGYGKIAVVPSVNLAYSDDRAREVKKGKGDVAGLLLMGEGNDRIEWKAKPPKKVKCMHTYDTQEWRPWDEYLEARTDA
ncbi:Alpha-1,3-mannosyltransferase [Lachnellula hyalina]|uniref:Alpha-1,3-mannosyltransferase n=1 Tax=Lachnellula hyalina TaxID=1316788 RepID=A0A8H8R3N4_9HELO|nr:Alpha-1,3-mannosyltransferase [Lachnellula hyalina]TVY27962.1 Alpha-1,3-mannosyltransferase [Lachnellula hyalina]